MRGASRFPTPQPKYQLSGTYQLARLLAARYLVNVVVDEGLDWDHEQDPVIAPSAYKHGVSEQDILHAYRNPIFVHMMEDDFIMIVGPNRATILLQIGIVDGVTSPVVIRAMPAREKFLR